MENLDKKLHISVGFILSGSLGDIQQLRQLILDHIGAELTPDGHIHQHTPSTSLRLIYHTLSRSCLFLVKNEDWQVLQDLKVASVKRPL